MPKNRLLSTLGIACLFPLVAWAQAPPAAPTNAPPILPAAEPPTEAETLIDAAAKQVAALKSVSADIEQKVDMLDQKFEVKGRFMRAPDHRTYLLLTVNGLADAEGSMLQVCDGETLWTYQKVLGQQSYSKFNVGKVFEKLGSSGVDASFRDLVINQLGFAGPEELLTGLRKTVKFNQKEAGKLDGRDVWVLRGEWRNRNAVLGQRQGPLPLTAALPAYIPSRVALTIGREDGWPYKLTLIGQKPSILMENRKSAAEARRFAAQDVKPTQIDLIYSNVKLNPNLKLEEFAFEAPPDSPVEDSTQQLVMMLDQRIQFDAAQKKAEASKSELPMLPEKIDVPAPPGGGVGPGVPVIPAEPPTPTPKPKS